MSVRSHHVAHHAANTLGFPATGGGGGTKKTTTKKKAPAKRLSAEEKAKRAAADDPYGNHDARRPGGAGRRTRVVRRRVRRRRVGTQQAKSNYGSGKTQGTKQGNKAKGQAKAQGPGPSNQHMMRRMLGQSNLNMMTAMFRSGQSSRPGGPQTPVGKKMAMLGNLQNYMKNDYAAMKANSQDNAFTYRTSEARQLVATLGSMVASTTNQGKKKDSKKSDSGSKGLSPAAFARQKNILRSLKAMSDPAGPLPEGLPDDYRPFDNVA